VSELIESRWTRYGKDRVYIRTTDGSTVGYVDLVERTVVADNAEYEQDLWACLAQWTGNSRPDLERPVTTLTSPPSFPEGVSTAAVAEYPETNSPDGAILRDLTDNAAGAAAWAKRNEINAQAPILNIVARLFGVKTEERAWRVGARGEEKVAAELAKLGTGWHVLHAVEVGDHGSDIDHVVIGPAGAFTLNTKRHPGAKAWIGEHRVMVNGQRTDYLRNSRFEAKRASRLLSLACHRPVEVAAAIVFVDLDDFTLKQMPADVHVTTGRRLIKWLRSLPTRMDNDAVDDIFAKARLSNTWR